MMYGWIEATVPLLLALLALSLTACARGTQDAEDGIRFERNSEFAGPHLRVFLTLQDGSEASVNTADDAIGTQPGETPILGHEARDWTFLKDAETGTTFAQALVSWAPANPADYLMAGWWIQFPGQHLPDLSFADTEQYGIVDGPEIDPAHPPELPPAEASASRAPRIRAASSPEPADDRGDRRRGSDMIARDRCVRMADSAANRQAGVADFGRRHAARAVGRTPRAFAIAVWGAEAVAGEWGSDSWMRSQVRRWFPKARALADSGWRDHVPRGTTDGGQCGMTGHAPPFAARRGSSRKDRSQTGAALLGKVSNLTLTNVSSIKLTATILS